MRALCTRRVQVLFDKETNTIVSNEPLDVTADALLPDRVESTGELAEPPSYSRKVS